MKSLSIPSFLFALNVFVSASPLGPFDSPGSLLNANPSPNPLASPATDGGLLQKQPDVRLGSGCSVRMFEFSGTMKLRGKCGGLSVAGLFWNNIYPGFAVDTWQRSDPNYFKEDQVQCCVDIECTTSKGDKGFCYNDDKNCPWDAGEKNLCPSAFSKCCSEDPPSKSSSSLPTYDNNNLLGSSGSTNSFDSNTLIPAGGDLAFGSDDLNSNLFTTTGDGSLSSDQDLSAFNPDDSSQVSFGLSGSSLLGDEGNTVVGLNGGSDQPSLFASAAEAGSALDTFS